MRAAWRAARRPSTLAARITASELLSRPECLDLPAAHTDRALTRRLAIDASGEKRSPPRLLEFLDEASNFRGAGRRSGWRRRRRRRRAFAPTSAAPISAPSAPIRSAHRRKSKARCWAGPP
jgi:NitT/TauT family transport system ATP-binding protein